MGVTTLSNFKIYDPQFWGGAIEVLQQNVDAFNGSSANTLRLVTRAIMGQFENESFLKYTSGLISHRDPTSTASVAAINLAMGEITGVKVNRRIGPVDTTRDAYKKAGLDPQLFSFQLGQQVGVEIAADYINTLISAVRAGIKAVAALTYDNTGQGTPTLNAGALVKGMAKFGDKASRLTCLVMHSKPYYDLVGQTITDKVVNVADVVLYGGVPATLGKPVIVLDSASLTNVNASGVITSYDVLALTDGAGTVTESEEREIESLPVLGNENLQIRLQGEHAYNLNVKGCTWDKTNGGANPTDTAIGTSSNWDQVVHDTKQMPGVAVTVS